MSIAVAPPSTVPRAGRAARVARVAATPGARGGTALLLAPSPAPSKGPASSKRPAPPKPLPLPAGFARSKCGSCIALCCRYFAMEVDRPTTPRDFDDLRWFMLHERVQVFTEGRKWFVQVFNPCSALGPDNRCTIYDQRPAICREYDNDWCDKDEQESDPKAGNDHVFHTLEELEAYRTRWLKRYEAARRRTRRQAAQRAARTRRRRERAQAAGRGKKRPARRG